MLRQRLFIALLIVPPGLFCIIQGGLWYFGTVLILFGLAAYEYGQLMQKTGNRPAGFLILGGVLTLIVFQALPALWPTLELQSGFLNGTALLGLVLAATLWHLIDFERGAPGSATDWATTLAGIVYLGLGGSYFIHLRALPDGLWWTMIVLPSIWLSDSGAYIVGKAWGRHALAPRLSPKKTWEGWLGGVVWGSVFGALFGGLGSLGSGPGSAVSFTTGAIVGLVVSVMGVIGDLAISMIKRQVGVKDTSMLLGAHGGLLDRIDSWVLAGPAAYLVIRVFFH